MKTSEVFGGSNSYLKAEDLVQGRAVRVTIENVTAKEFQTDDGRMVNKLILHFVNKDKALVCNRTNAATIETVTGTDETNDWIGWSIALYGTKVPFGNKLVPAIRVMDQPGSARKPERLQKRAAPVPPMREPGDDDDVPMDAAPDITEDDIPFAWVLPLLLPFVAAGMALWT